ncbi:unnamed protein product, partial [Didymodactylos carnosus]
QPYNYDANGFPSLITASCTKPHKAWNNQCNKLNDMTNSQLFSQLKEFFNDKFEQVNKRLNVIEQQVKMNEHYTRSNKIRLSELFLKQKDLISTTLKPALSAIPNIDVKLIENLDDFDKFCSLAEECLRMEYHFSGMTRSLATKSEIILNNNYQPQQTLSNRTRKDQEQSEEKARNRLRLCGFSDKEVKNLHVYLSEWYESNSLEDAVEKWETYGIKQNVVPNKQNVLLSFCLFNVQGWKSRALEVLHLIQKAEASLAICTEVGAYWDSFKLPNFNMFYQEGTNHCGGVTIAVGKHLKATKIDSNLENTIVSISRV